MRPPERVLMTADAVGGVWRYAIDLAGELHTRGLHVTMAAMGPAPNGPQRREAARAGVDLIDRPYRLEWMDDPWSDVEQAGSWLLDVARQLKPSVVHLNGYAHAPLPFSAPVVVVAHSCVRTWWQAVRREVAPSHVDRYTSAVTAGLAAARAVVAPTYAMGTALAREYQLTQSIQIIPNGCTRGALPAADFSKKERFVFAAGRLWDEAKNISALSAVAPLLEWPVYVAGEARAPSGQHHRPANLQALGRLSPRALSDWYRRASIYALPARYEPFGLSVLEAAAAGCALVLGDIPSLRENWDGAALFVTPDDRAALAIAVQRLIADPDQRISFAHRALERAGGFTLTRTTDAYVRTYQGVLP